MIRFFAALAVLFALLGIPSPAFADAPDMPSTFVIASELPDGGALALPAATVADVADVIRDVTIDAKIIAAASAAGDKTKLYLAIAALLSVLFRFLILIGERIVDVAPAAKVWIPWLCLVLGVGVAVSARYASGATWLDAIIAGGSGPGALIVNELLALFKSPAPAKA